MHIKKIIENHLFMSAFYKGLSGLSLLVTTSILLKFFGASSYGIWVLVFALFQWIFSMDFGLASVLKTKVPILLQNNQIDLLKIHIRSTYKITIFISCFIFLVFYILIKSLNLKVLFKIPEYSENFITYLFLINIFFFCLNFILNVHKSLFVAFLKGKYAEQSIALNQLLFFISLMIITFLCSKFSIESKLLIISVANGVISILINGFYNFYFFYITKLNLYTNLKSTNNILKEILSLGFKYMVIQLGLLFVFSSDNYILSNVFGPKEVVGYEVVNKLFQFPIMIIFAALSPLWSVFANDYFERDHTKLYKKFNQFNIFFVLIIFFIIAIATFTPTILSYWLKTEFVLQNHLIIYITITTIIRVFVTFYSFFLYGVGKLKVYILILFFTVIVKLPLTYFFISLNFGVNSVIISTMLLMFFWLLLIPRECYIIVNNLKKQNNK
jgi:O-antigen/teichoic acid export membrane protein